MADVSSTSAATTTTTTAPSSSGIQKAEVLANAWSEILTPATINTSAIIQTVVREQQLLNLQVWELTEKLREAASTTTAQQKEVEQYTARLKATRARADAVNRQLLVIKTRLMKVHERLRARTNALKRDNDILREELTEEKRSAKAKEVAAAKEQQQQQQQAAAAKSAAATSSTPSPSPSPPPTASSAIRATANTSTPAEAEEEEAKKGSAEDGAAPTTISTTAVPLTATTEAKKPSSVEEIELAAEDSGANPTRTATAEASFAEERPVATIASEHEQQQEPPVSLPQNEADDTVETKDVDDTKDDKKNDCENATLENAEIKEEKEGKSDAVAETCTDETDKPQSHPPTEEKQKSKGKGKGKK